MKRVKVMCIDEYCKKKNTCNKYKAVPEEIGQKYFKEWEIRIPCDKYKNVEE